MLFYCCSIVVLLLFYCCSIVVLLLFYFCSIVVLLLFYCCSIVVLLLFYCCSIVVLFLFCCCCCCCNLNVNVLCKTQDLFTLSLYRFRKCFLTHKLPNCGRVRRPSVESHKWGYQHLEDLEGQRSPGALGAFWGLFGWGRMGGLRLIEAVMDTDTVKERKVLESLDSWNLMKTWTCCCHCCLLGSNVSCNCLWNLVQKNAALELSNPQARRNTYGEMTPEYSS